MFGMGRAVRSSAPCRSGCWGERGRRGEGSRPGWRAWATRSWSGRGSAIGPSRWSTSCGSAGETGSTACAPARTHDAAAAELVVLATVWDAAVATATAHAEQLAGKAVISMANGLTKEGRQFVPVVSPAGSIAAAVQAVAPDARVVAAFHHVPAAALADLDHHLTSDVLVVGDETARDDRPRPDRRHPRPARARRRPARQRARHRDVLRRPPHREPPPQGRGDAPTRRIGPRRTATS